MNNGANMQYNQLLEGIARELDIPPSKYQIAVDRYKTVGNWLQDAEHFDLTGKPNIYPQGSFRLGTVVRPYINGQESDYDIDLVVQMNDDKLETKPANIKAIIGNRLMENADYKRMLDDEGKRCWTLNYAEQDGIGFHMDILPSVREEEATIEGLVQIGVSPAMAQKAIAISDKQHGNYSWTSSNPSGYAEWFEEVNKPMFSRLLNEAKKAIFESNRAIFARIEDVPDQLVKTPLQRAIQILKRHRDLRFAGQANEDDKPISMIITTLSARLYNSEADVFSTLRNILEKLNNHAGLLTPGYSLPQEYNDLRLITRKPDGTWLIPNPVNPNENFAERWHENNDSKAKAFFQWVSWVYADIIGLAQNEDFARTKKLLSNRFGESLIEKAAKAIAVAAPVYVPPSTPRVNITTPSKPWGCL